MNELRDSGWYQAEAERVHRKAEATTDPGLRENYLKLSEAYQGLAETRGRIPYFFQPHS